MKKITLLLVLCLISAGVLLAQQKDSRKSSEFYASSHPAYSLTTPVPTFIIDGVVIPADPNGKVPKQVAELNPNEIAKMEVIKSDIAVVLYGDASKNGIVKITTTRRK